MRASGGRPALRRAAWIVLGGAILGAFLVPRLPLLTVDAAFRNWNGDAAIFGLMAKKIRDGAGIDVFYWGQNYMGPLTSALAAALRRAFLDPAGCGAEAGPIAVRLAIMGEIAAGIAFFTAGLARLFGPFVAAATGLWLAVGPAWLVRLSAAERPGPEMSFALGSVLFFLAACALTEERPFLLRPAGLVALGLLGGIGWWMNQTIVFVLVPAAAVAFFRDAATPRRVRAALVFGGSVLGYAPVWMGRLLGWYEPFLGPVVPRWRIADAPARAASFLGTGFWQMVGLEGVAPPFVLAAALVLAGVLVVSSVRHPGEGERAVPPGARSLLGASVVLAAAALVLRDVAPSQLRFVSPALPAALALLVVAAGEAGTLLRRRFPSVAVAGLVWAAGAGLAAGVALVLLGRARAAIDEVRAAPDPRPVLRAIEEQGYTVCHAGYDVAYALWFLSDERVRFVPFHSPDRNRPLSARLRAVPEAQCLVSDDGSLRRWLPSDAAQEGGPARRRAARP